MLSALLFTTAFLPLAMASKPTIPWTINASVEKTSENEVTVYAVLHATVSVENMSFRINPLAGELLRGNERWQGSVDSSDKIYLEAVFSHTTDNAQWIVLANGRVGSVKMGKRVDMHLKNNNVLQKAQRKKNIKIKAGAEEYPAF